MFERGLSGWSSGTFAVPDGRTRGGGLGDDESLPVRSSPGAQAEGRGGPGPVGGLLGGKDLIGRFHFGERSGGRWGRPGRWCRPCGSRCPRFHVAPIGALTVRAEDAEHVVVAGGGVVADDDSRQIDASVTARGDVDAAALALAVAEAGGTGSAGRPVAGDRATGEGEDRRLVGEDAAAQAVAAVTQEPRRKSASSFQGRGITVS